MKRRRTNSGRVPRARGLAVSLLAGLLAAFLAACSSLSDGPGLAGAHEPAYLLTIDLSEGDTQAEVLRRHGGEIEMWVDGHFAVLGFSSSEAAKRSGDFSLLGAGNQLEPNQQFASDPNAIEMQGTSGLWAGGTSTLWAGGTSRIWAGGTSRIWAGGTSYLWAGGTSYLWAGGHFVWMPENSDVWRQIRLDVAHRMVADTLGAGIRVAVIDTGVDLGHPALREAVDQGYDFVDDDPVPDEEGTEADAGYGHGTSVAGIVRQIAPRATIVPYRVLGPDGSGTALDLAEAIQRAVDEGADIINLSLGGAKEDAAVAAALTYAGWNGVFVVASTGDSGNETVTYPANVAHLSPYMVSLTSVDKRDRKSDFGPHHVTQVELSSPGEYIFGPAPDIKAAAWSGTSMSTPMAAGALALALGVDRNRPQLRVDDMSLTQLLLTYSEDINEQNPEYAGELGDGRLDVASFLAEIIEHGKRPNGNNDGRGHPKWGRNDVQEGRQHGRGTALVDDEAGSPGNGARGNGRR